MLGNLNLSLARRTMMRQLGWGMDLDGVGENLSIVNPKNIYSGEYSLRADFSGDVVGQSPAGWTTQSGAFQVKQYVIDPSPNLVTNGGGVNTTDWIDSNLDGVADGWDIAGIPPGDMVGSIVSGNGFFNRAQRFEVINATGSWAQLQYTAYYLKPGRVYNLSFKYRANIGIIEGVGGTVGKYPANTGNAITVTRKMFLARTNEVLLTFRPSDDGSLKPGWLELDEVKLTEASPLESIISGIKYTECTSSGYASIPYNQAFGKWEFDVFKGNDNNEINISFIALKPSFTIGYAELSHTIRINNLEQLHIKKDGSNLLMTAANYVSNNIWYRIKVERLTNGQFSLYIKGGAFGSEYISVGVAGGSGTNPVTDATYTNSNYFVIDLDQGDRIANIECQYASGSLDLFGWERFFHSGNRDFEQATNYGPDLFSGYNFTSGWAVYLGSISSANSFTTDGVGGNGGIYKSPGVATVGRTYRLDIAGNTTASSIAVYDGTGGGIFLGNISGNFNSTFYYTVSNAPTTAKGSIQIINQSAGTTTITMLSLREVKSDWQKVGNHDCYVSGEEKYSGSNCLKVASTGAGDSNNCIFIAADKFLTLIAGKKFCSQRRIKTSVDCTMSVQFGDKVVSRAIVAGSWILTPWTFEASANTTGKPCKIWFDRAVTAYMDEIGLAEHFPTTWSVWFRTSAAGSNIVLLSQNNGINTNTSLGYALRKSATDVINLLVYDQSGNAYSISSAGVNCADGKWHLATITLDASLPGGQCKVFIDGIFIASGTAAIGNINNTSVYTVGKYAYTPVGYWLGQIGQIQQIRGVKSDTQILADFKGGIARRTDSMLNLKFSGPDDATMLKDYSPLNQQVTGINVTKADQVRGSYPYFSK